MEQGSMDGIGAKGLQTKLIVNYLPQSMSDNEFRVLFQQIGPLESYRIMRDKATNYSFGYGFIDYESPEDALTAIAKLNEYRLENKTLRVAFSKPQGASKNINLYVTGLGPQTDELKLRDLFSVYGELVQVKIIRDQSDNSSKGFGFVLFKENSQADAAIRSLQGHCDGHEPLPVEDFSLNSLDLPKLPPTPPFQSLLQERVDRDRGKSQIEDKNPSNQKIKYAKESSEQQRSHRKYQEYLRSNFQTAPSQMVSYSTEYGTVIPIGAGQVAYATTDAIASGYGGGYGTVEYGIPIAAGNQKALRGRGAPRYNPIARPIGAGAMAIGLTGVGVQEGPPVVVFAYNIGANATESDMYGLFSKYGRITKVDVIAGKGFGFVHMPIAYEASDAVKSLNGAYYNGKYLQVSIKSRK